MVLIGTWVVRTACRQLRAWLDEGLPKIRMAVNVSLCQLQRGNLAEVVSEILEETGLEPSLLELELSERGVLRSDPEVMRQLEELKARGVRLSVDDFGTGQSAIAYLRKFPLDTLKIDRSFVNGVLTSENDATITAAMVAMAQRLRLEVVAEGVELEKQLDFLSQWGCNEFQGYLFSPPVAAHEARELLMREANVRPQ
jgi:EAL domain-containing protein (putative c-di-GMP-specific phosphodiesterase class I)